MFRFELDGRGVVGNGLIVFALVSVAEAAIIIRRGILRGEPDGLGVVGYGFAKFALIFVDPALRAREIIDGRTACF